MEEGDFLSNPSTGESAGATPASAAVRRDVRDLRADVVYHSLRPQLAAPDGGAYLGPLSGAGGGAVVQDGDVEDVASNEIKTAEDMIKVAKFHRERRLSFVEACYYSEPADSSRDMMQIVWSRDSSSNPTVQRI